ncbi:phenolic acid decarboxylase [Barrientosiimonas humi]|uniref:Phenolic acid decarboxylase n=2 Tax=Barrientosiimonas TaxID=1535207 RepID=A0A542XDI8_9MICO|nr:MULTISPECIES: phenolic acid decarboxylase [Barrientosiimonas]TQL33875.1 phenolic acid decarboxylase [Barrientosiimonas humi]BDZ58825.1 phenolic acid decarboxylase [Barrientosiimonas endolithica]CAG7573866.1 Phenolic acid decarboxylase PadC [Barrientosiimonas humi]
MSAALLPAPDDDTTGLQGKHLIYTYANGWRYELFVKNAGEIDYRIHSGDVAGRWVKGQPVQLSRLGEQVFTVSWNEPTGTCVSLVVNLADRWVHGAIFFAQWVHQDPARTALFQNEHLDEMYALRDQGPVAPLELLDEAATITFVEQCDVDDDTVIDRAPSELPEGYVDRTS